MNKYKVTMIDHNTGFEVSYYLEAEYQVAAETYANHKAPLGWQVKEVIKVE